MMRLRQTVEFADGVTDANEVWPDVYRDADAAARWGAVMERLYPGAIAKEQEQECDEHGWEDLTLCADCGFPTCRVEGLRAESRWDDILCPDCMESRSEDAEEDRGRCLAPAGAGAPPCHCGKHGGMR